MDHLTCIFLPKSSNTEHQILNTAAAVLVFFFETTDMNQLFKNTQIGPKCMFNADFNFHKMLIL